ncbi:MAG: hypothetical protein IKE03_02440 [Blautia sp.]|nr:hypothetical protein [Blautia sp.]
MLMEAMANYEYYQKANVKPDWVRLERLDYCDQGMTEAKAAFDLKESLAGLRRLFHTERKQAAFS